MPGDVIEYKNDVLYVNGTETDEPYIKQYLKKSFGKRTCMIQIYKTKSLLSLGFTTQDRIWLQEFKSWPLIFRVEVPLTGYFLIGDN